MKNFFYHLGIYRFSLTKLAAMMDQEFKKDNIDDRLRL